MVFEHPTAGLAAGVACPGRDTHERYKGLTPADRRAVVEILLETKKGLPAYFKRLS